jgi:hypothetical protein
LEEAGGFYTEDLFDLGFQQWYICDYRLPDDVQIERKIFVRDIVPETGNRLPTLGKRFLRAAESREAASPITNN